MNVFIKRKSLPIDYRLALLFSVQKPAILVSLCTLFIELHCKEIKA